MEAAADSPLRTIMRGNYSLPRTCIPRERHDLTMNVYLKMSNFTFTRPTCCHKSQPAPQPPPFSSLSLDRADFILGQPAFAVARFVSPGSVLSGYWLWRTSEWNQTCYLASWNQGESLWVRINSASIVLTEMKRAQCSDLTSSCNRKVQYSI